MLNNLRKSSRKILLYVESISDIYRKYYELYQLFSALKKKKTVFQYYTTASQTASFDKICHRDRIGFQNLPNFRYEVLFNDLIEQCFGIIFKDNKKPSRSRPLEKTSQQFIFFAFHLKQSIFPFLFITGFDSQENCVYFEHYYYFLFAMKHTRQNTLHSNSKIKLKIFKMQNPAEDLQRGFERIQGFGTAKWFGAKWLEGWNVGVEVL